MNSKEYNRQYWITNKEKIYAHRKKQRQLKSMEHRFHRKIANNFTFSQL